MNLLLLLIIEQEHMHTSEMPFGSEQLFGLLELPFLIVAVIFSFLTASRLKGGKFGNGMALLAWGFVIMAIGHLCMQIDHIYNVNIFDSLLGDSIGRYA